MNTRTKLIFILTALTIGLCLSASCAWAGGSSPAAVAKQFTKSFYMLDDDMAEYLSEDALTNDNDVNMVELFLRLKQDEARNRGYDVSYLQMFPILTKTHVVSMDDQTAVVDVKITALRSINPLYRAVGYIFCLLEEHDFDTTLTLVKEDGEWKVGPGVLALAI